MSDTSAAPAVAVTADLLGADFFTLLGLPKRFELDLGYMQEYHQHFEPSVSYMIQ